MNFLGIVNRLRRECGVTSADLATLAGTLTRENTLFKEWANDAWLEVQIAHPDWKWMRSSFTYAAASGAQQLGTMGLTDVSDWKRDSFRSYSTATGTNDEQILPYMEFDTWRNVYAFGSMRSATGRPAVLTVNPDRTVACGPVLVDAYTIAGEYYHVPTDLLLDTDDPSATGNGLPDRYHMLIVYMAMRKYAAYYVAPEVESRGATGERKFMRRLEFDYLPTLISGPPLA
jgi:hypothetical protein